jgi:1-deoxy-D-xylulose-5-phosphate reductoisomerase
MVMAAIVGAAGMVPTLAAARAGKRVLLANKEALVMSGALFMREVPPAAPPCCPSTASTTRSSAAGGLRGGVDGVEVTRILLTASGGPFRRKPSKSSPP